MKHLHLSDAFSMPAEAVTQTFAFLGKRGVGKTHTMAVLVEELLGVGAQVVVADPIGVWWGLRAAADGKAAGLPILVMGGDHGDVPLEVTAGELVADLIVDEQLSVVLDLARFRKGEQTRFMQDFSERLYHRNRAPLHLVLDEADAFAPQRPMPGEQRLLGAIEDLVRRGRARGIGVSLATQRAAVLNKNVLTQVEVLVALRLIAPQDRAAVEAWIEVHGTTEQQHTLMASLPSLPIGTAWFWSPGWLDVFQRVAIRRRRTFDSSATPKMGQRLVAPKQLAAVDLAAIGARIAATVERAKANDPRELRKRIAEMERQLAAKPTAAVERVEVPVVLDDTLSALQLSSERLGEETERLAAAVDQIRATVAKLGHRPPAPALRTQHQHHGVVGGGPAAAKVEGPRRLPSRPAPVVPAGGAQLARGERFILTALAQYPSGRTKVQVALLTGYAHNGGGFNNYVSALRTRGLIDGTGDALRITPAGLEALGDYTPLPTGPALFRHWCSQVGKAERLVLEALGAAYPAGLTKEEAAARAGYAPDGGGFNNALSRLRTLELISGRGELRMSEDLA